MLWSAHLARRRSCREDFADEAFGTFVPSVFDFQWKRLLSAECASDEVAGGLRLLGSGSLRTGIGSSRLAKVSEELSPSMMVSVLTGTPARASSPEILN